MFKLVIKDIRQKTTSTEEDQQQPYAVHITRNLIKLSKDSPSNLRSLVYYNDATHTIYLFFTNENKDWHLTSNYTPMYTIDHQLDLSSFNIVRYVVTGNVDATIENYTSTYLSISTAKNSRVRFYVSGSKTSVRTSIRSNSRLSICGSANVLKIRSLHANSYLDLTSFNGGHLFRNEHDVAQQSILCGMRLTNDEETTRQRYVREHIKIPSLKDVSPPSSSSSASTSSSSSSTIPSCLLCYEYQANITCIPCKHSCMCLQCTQLLHTQNQSLFTCPLCRTEIMDVRLDV